ncbi:MAG: transforming growth factor-beta-induced protein [Verrucomicrobiales bacterium]|jgi:transforming growth factor-beta-induced protein
MTHRKTTLCLVPLLATALWAGAVSPEEKKSDTPAMVLADFEEGKVADGWKTVNDNVMGGRSKGEPSFKNGILTFSGATNTNGGGFSSIRTEPSEFDLSGKSGLLIRARGDGRTYKAELRTDISMRSWTVPFRADFKTVKGEWREFYLPLKSFKPTLFGQKLPTAPKLDPAKVSSVGFMIYDKQDGDFSLEVDWVKAVAQEKSDSGKKSETIVSKALADGRFGTLAAALTESGLLEVLQGEGPFTVFAPTDEAFAKLPEGTVEDLLKPENREKLQAVLKYHVSPGAIGLVAALEAGATKTVQGESVSIAFTDGRVRINGASIVNADITCSNGVIHVIDSVLLPPAPANDIPSVAKRAGSFGTLLAAVQAAGLDGVLASEGPFTIFAPTDAAFKALPKDTLKELLKEESRDQLKAILSYHAIAGKISAGDALNARSAKTLNGKSVEFGIKDGMLKINGVTISTTDIQCDNGVIHVIDAVLLPPSEKNASRQKKSAAKAKAPMSPAEQIEGAIDRGVPVFNGGDPGKCAEIYKECLTGLVKDQSIDPKARTVVKGLIDRASKAESDADRAWIYRSGLDHLYDAITKP